MPFGFEDIVPFIDTGLNKIFGDDRQEDMQAFNAEQSAISRAWQERMDNTRYQRHKADLEAAGFNPMLELAHGGAGGTPGGSTASSGAVSPLPSTLTAGMATAAQIQLTKAATEKTEAEAEEIRQRTPTHPQSIAESKAREDEVRSRIPVNQEQVKNIQQQIVQSSVEIERIWATESRERSSAAHLDQQIKNLKATLPQIEAQVKNLQAMTAQSAATTTEIRQRIKANLPEIERILGNLKATAEKMKQPEQANQAAAADSYIGQLGAYLQRINPLKGWMQ